MLEDDLKFSGWKMTSTFLKAVLRSPRAALLMLESKLIQIPTISLLFRVGGRVAGWVAGGIEIKANSVQFQLKLPVGTELGKIIRTLPVDKFEASDYHFYVVM